MIEALGGKLANRLARGQRAAELEAETGCLPFVRLSAFELSDLEMLSLGRFSPLEGGQLPRQFTRPGIAAILQQAYQPAALTNGFPEA